MHFKHFDVETIDEADPEGETRWIMSLSHPLERKTKIVCFVDLSLESAKAQLEHQAALGAVGARVRQLPDGLEIEPGPRRPALLDSYADHRMVMAAAVLGLAIDGVQVGDPGAVTKTLPDFRERWARLLGDPVGATR